jgi:hypothetical protein
LKIKIAPWFCISISLISFILNLFMLCFDQAKEFLSNIKEEVGAKDHIQSVKNSRPKIIFHIECYHYDKKDY